MYAWAARAALHQGNSSQGPLLSTHLPVPEIAAELFLSPHTIKSEMKSIYRKLGATTRTQAVSRSRELGLLGL